MAKEFISRGAKEILALAEEMQKAEEAKK